MITSATAVSHPIEREQFLNILQAAISVREYRYAREAALAWLAVYPGDLTVSLLYAQVMLGDQRAKPVIPVLDKLCQTDPENLPALESYFQAQQLLHQPIKSDLKGSLLALGSTLVKREKDSAWGRELAAARHTNFQGDPHKALELFQNVLGNRQHIPLVAVTHLQILESLADTPAIMKQKLGAFYHDKFPDCLQVTLCLADWLMDGGEFDQAVGLLHEAAGKDVSAQVVERLWGANHPYQSLWPETLEATIEIPVPAAVAAIFGWNQIPARNPVAVASTAETQRTKAGSTTRTKEGLPPRLSNETETLKPIQDELERIARRLNQPGLTRTDGRFPVYVVFSSRRGLLKQYGPEGASAILTEMNGLVDIIQNDKKSNGNKNWQAGLFLADDPENLERLGVEPAASDDAWHLKLALADLDAALARHGEMIGALLIVGGPEVVPFHHLPNPVDDTDCDVPSDNPYATRDENYFIPEWSVGRLPGGNSSDPALLIQQLKAISKRHAKVPAPASWTARVWLQLRAWLRPSHLIPGWIDKNYSFGYTAAVWRRAAYQVYAPIGRPIDMWVSPELAQKPNHKVSGGGHVLPLAVLGYFNLHGMADAPQWLGQRDPHDGKEGQDYPVALSPDDIAGELTGQTTPKIVFTEACYGAHILKKGEDDSLALKFLAAGTTALVGSTCMAYGSINEQLTAADMLGQAFWTNLQTGLNAGEALRRAKLQMARELQQAQGYLDGMDQKTLISFVLYGDPLAQPVVAKRVSKSIQRALNPKSVVKTVCDLDGEIDPGTGLSSKEKDYIRHVVARYLPGMQDAAIDVHTQQATCQECDKNCPTSHLRSKNVLPAEPPSGRRLVILSKKVASSTQLHTQIARMTLDPDGKLIKLVVSR